MMEVKFGLNTKCFVIRTPPCTASSSSTEFSQIYAIHSSSRQYIYLLSACFMYIPAAWPGFEEFLRGLYILCMSFLPDRAHIRCITTTCLRIINKCNLKGEKGWYIYAGRGRYALRIRRKIPEISMFHSYI